MFKSPLETNPFFEPGCLISQLAPSLSPLVREHFLGQNSAPCFDVCSRALSHLVGGFGCRRAPFEDLQVLEGFVVLAVKALENGRF